MKIEPDNFIPQIWETTDKGRPRLKLLVCGKCFVHSPEIENTVTGTTSKTVVERFTHPVAIVMTTPAIVLYSFTDSEHTWKILEQKDHGMSRREAQTALSEAYRGVEWIRAEITNPTSPVPPNPHWRFKVAMATPDDPKAPDPKTTEHETSMLRNINAWVNWSRWIKQRLTLPQRAEELTKMGFPTTTKALESAAGKAGL
jgi:hypothetical protein